MHPDRMRAIDRRVGKPICAVVTMAMRLRRLFVREEDRAAAPPRTILFIALAEIGALVLTQPALRLARQRYPDARFVFLTFPGGVGMLELMGFARADILVIDPSSLVTLARSSLAARRSLRGARGVWAVIFEVYARFATLLAAFAGAERRAGFHSFREEGGYIGGLLTHRAIYSPHRHIAESYVALVDALGDAGGDEPCAKRPGIDAATLRLTLPRDGALADAVLQRVGARLGGEVPAGGLVLLNANSSDLVPLRRWPDENYVELARRLLAAFPVAIVLTGSPAEAAQSVALAARMDDPRVVAFAGETTLPELIALYHTARLLVTNDSGPAHFASTTDIASVVLYGPETPRLFGPLGPRQQSVTLSLLCSPCVSVYNQKSSACSDNLCLKGITVGQVFERCARILDGQA